MIRHQAFLDLEESLAARLRQSWSRYWSDLSADILHLTAQGKFDEAHKLADTLELAPLFDKARPYARTIGMSALLLGASRITPSIRNSRIAKLPPKDKLDGYLNQLNVMLARNATQALREQAHAWITEEEQKLVKFDPSQPRHPKGTPEGGQWADLKVVERGSPTKVGVVVDSGQVRVKNPAQIEADVLPIGIQVRWSEVADRWKGTGLGVRIYAKLADYAHSRGLPLLSDTGVSPEAQKMYEALERRGYHVERNPQVKRFPSGNLIVLQDSEDHWVFRVTVPIEKAEWREEDHPRGKSTPESTPGSFTSVTGTPEFKAWFGKSRVVGKDGKPVKLYHATRADFSEFRITGEGAHFGTLAQAESRASDGIVMPVYLSIQNPLRVKDLNTFGPGNLSTYLLKQGVLSQQEYQRVDNAGNRTKAWPVLRDLLEAKGFDGLVYRNEQEGDTREDSWMIFRPEQVKSAFNSRPTDHPHLMKDAEFEAQHPRGKTTPESTPGSFMPKINWYHGTLTDVLDQILKEGIKPGSETGKRRWSPDFYQDPIRAESVFVASSMPQAEGWAIDAAYNMNDIERAAGNHDAPLMTPVVLEVEVPRDVAEQSVKDSMTLNEFHRMHRGRIPPEWIKGYTIIQLRRVGPMGFIEVADRKHHALRKSDNTFYVVVMVRDTMPVKKADADRNQVKILTAGKQYFALAASVQVSRLSAFGFLAEAAEKGLTNYRVDAVLDEKTCEVCRHMDGWVFPVDAGLALATQIMETDDPDALKSIAPFYAQNKASLAALATYGTEDFIETGMSLPPYHPLCRCILTPTNEAADVHPTDLSDRVALASQTLYGEGDGVRLTQNLFGVRSPPPEPVAVPQSEEESQLLEMLGQLVTEQVPATEPEWQQLVLSRLLAPEMQPAALVSPVPFEGTTIPNKWVKPFDPAKLASLAASKWPWLAALLGWMALRQPEQASAFATDEDEEDEEEYP